MDRRSRRRGRMWYGSLSTGNRSDAGRSRGERRALATARARTSASVHVTAKRRRLWRYSIARLWDQEDRIQRRSSPPRSDLRPACPPPYGDRTHLSLLQSRSQERLEVLCRFPALVRLDARLQAVHVGMAGLEGWRRQCGSDDALSLLHVPATPKEVLDARVLQRRMPGTLVRARREEGGGTADAGNKFLRGGSFGQRRRSQVGSEHMNCSPVRVRLWLCRSRRSR